MTYYEKYNSYLLFITLLLGSVFLIIAFKKKINSLIDPLALHLVSTASALALLFGFVYKNMFDENSFSFLLVYIIYLPSLFYFLNSNPSDNYIPSISNSRSKQLKLYVISVLLILYSRYDFFIYAIKSTPIEWFLYRFKLIEGRDPLQYICRIGATSFFYYFSFILLTEKIWSKKVIIFILVFNLLIETISGGRSSMINFILSYGLFLYKFPGFFSKKYINKVNFIGLIGVSISITVAILVTSMYGADSSFEDGMSKVLNRMLAAGDGLEMYLVNHADRYIETGFFEYIKSAFGIFVSNIFGVKTKSFGWRLYELDQGYDILNSVGPNFILPLQVIALSKYLLVPYVILFAYLTAKLRNFNLKGHPALSYSMAINAFYLSTDLEFASLIYVSTFAVYILIFLPIQSFKIYIPNIKFSFK